MALAKRRKIQKQESSQMRKQRREEEKRVRFERCAAKCKEKKRGH